MPNYTASRLKFWSGCDKSLRQKDVPVCLPSLFTLAEKGAPGTGRQPLSPPQHTEARSAMSAPNRRTIPCSF
jgi:hypothetical protein